MIHEGALSVINEPPGSNFYGGSSGFFDVMPDWFRFWTRCRASAGYIWR